ncbi:uncharacterized protein LOC114579295 [Dendrobium catenatum]|uniref:uncharacterized protein LOC114579295 n=1 Tax=Dendrobium catenatum TaxID=906689 RepID=UPI00109F8EF9|nr:uncharacterized protein LOC114579295 [Dendrobium catenatum]
MHDFLEPAVHVIVALVFLLSNSNVLIFFVTFLFHIYHFHSATFTFSLKHHEFRYGRLNRLFQSAMVIVGTLLLLRFCGFRVFQLDRSLMLDYACFLLFDLFRYAV